MILAMDGIYLLAASVDTLPASVQAPDRTRMMPAFPFLYVEPRGAVRPGKPLQRCGSVLGTGAGRLPRLVPDDADGNDARGAGNTPGRLPTDDTASAVVYCDRGVTDRLSPDRPAARGRVGWTCPGGGSRRMFRAPAICQCASTPTRNGGRSVAGRAVLLAPPISFASVGPHRCSAAVTDRRRCICAVFP